MPRHHIVGARHAQGLQAYRAGHTIRDLVGIAEAIDEMYKEDDLSDEEHQEIKDAIPSVMAGFLDGLIEDIRTLARPRQGTRA